MALSSINMPSELRDRLIQMVVEDSNDAIAVSLGPKPLFANRACLRLYGLPDDTNLEGKSILDLMAPEVRAMVAKNMEKRLAGIAVPDFYKVKALRPDGSTFDAEVRLSSLPIGEKIYSVAIMREITAAVEAERALKESEARFRSLVEMSPYAIIIHAAGRIRYANQAAVTLLRGASREQLYATPVINVVHPDYRKKVGERMQNITTTETNVDLIEEKFLCFDGTVVDVEVVGGPVKYGQEHAIQVICRDITERKHAKKLAALLSSRFRDLLENIQLIGVMLDTEGKIVFANRYCIELSGWSWQDLSGVDWFSKCFPSDVAGEMRRVFKESMITGNMPVHYEKEMVTRDGRKRMIRWDNTIQRDETGKIIGVAAVGRDVTEQRMIEEQLRQAQKMEAIGKLAGGMAHDLNNQLAGIMGCAEILYEKEKDPGLRAYANRIIETSRLVADLNYKLLSFARRTTTENIPVDLHELVSQIVGIMRRTAGTNLTIETDLRAPAHTIVGDHAQLQNALLNVALNARDAMPKGGKLMISTSVVKLDSKYRNRYGCVIKPGPFVALQLTDQGVGMPAMVMQHLFEPFFTTKESGAGTGLGLASVFGAIKAHSGAIEVESEEGKGSTFTLLLPLRSDLDVAKPAGSTQVSGSPAGGRILVVDDEEGLREIVSLMLTQAGYDVVTCGSGAEAVEKFGADPAAYDVVILDMLMPGMDGRDTFHALRKISPQLKVLISTGFTDEKAIKEIIEAGTAGVIKKPYSREVLLKTLAEIR